LTKFFVALSLASVYHGYCVFLLFPANAKEGVKMQRKREISSLNCLFCVMVVCIHLLSEPVTRFEKGTWQYAVAFVPQQLMFVSVYGFVFLSGLKLFIRPPGRKTDGVLQKAFCINSRAISCGGNGVLSYLPLFLRLQLHHREYPNVLSSGQNSVTHVFCGCHSAVLSANAPVAMAA
jgi:hypothetical protein